MCEYALLGQVESNKNISSWIIRSLKIIEEFIREESSASHVCKESVINITKI